MTTAAALTGENQAVLQSYLNKQNALDTKPKDTGKSLASDFNTFLKILTTQLQNQDPLSAQDSNAFTEQLVQFASVEQQINANAKLDTLISQSKASGITPLLSYVGKNVELESGGKMLLQDGRALLHYKVNDSLSDVRFTVKDSTGITVASFAGPHTPGEQKVAWDGKLANGTQLKDNTYQITVEGTKPDGTKVDLGNAVRIVGRVDAIQSAANGAVSLGVGSLSIKDTDILAVYQGPNS